MKFATFFVVCLLAFSAVGVLGSSKYMNMEAMARRVGAKVIDERDVPSSIRDSAGGCCLNTRQFQFNTSGIQFGFSPDENNMQFAGYWVDQDKQILRVSMDQTNQLAQNSKLDVWMFKSGSGYVQRFTIEGQPGCFEQAVGTDKPEIFDSICTPPTLAGYWLVGDSLRVVFTKEANTEGQIISVTPTACIPTMEISWVVNTTMSSQPMLSVQQNSYHGQQLYLSEPSRLVPPTGCVHVNAMKTDSTFASQSFHGHAARALKVARSLF